MSDKPILMTDETRAAIGERMVAFLEEQDIKPTLIVSRHDFESENVFEWLGDQGRMDNLLDRAGIKDPATRTEVKAKFQFFATEGNNAYGGIFIDPNPRKQGWNDKGTPGSSFPLPAITAPNVISAASYFSETTGIPESEFSPAVHSLNRDDLAAWVLFHEVGHTNPEQILMNRPEKELDSDLHANMLYAKAYERGLVQDRNVPEFRSYIRALVPFTNPSGSILYPYNGAVDPDEHGDTVEKEAQENPGFVHDAVADVYRALGHRTARTEFEALIDMNYEGFLSPQQAEILEALEGRQYDDVPPSLEELEAFMETVIIPPEKQKYFEDTVDSLIIEEGKTLAEEQPGLLYETAKEKLLRGDYNETPVVKQQMENFVVGAERIAPAHFGIEGQPYTDYLRKRGEDLASGLPPTPGTQDRAPVSVMADAPMH